MKRKFKLPNFNALAKPKYATNGPRVAWFVENYCTHAKGEWFGKPLMMEPWQRWVLNEMFRVDPSTGMRQWREVCLMIPRGNAKSTLIAALGFYFLIFDGEGGPDVFSSAWGEDQARMVFDSARTMHDSSPNLQAVSQKFAKAITCPTNAGSWRIVSRIAETKQGSNAHALLNDEYHVHKSHELRDAFKRGMQKRRQPLLVDITTEGSSKQSPLGLLQAGYFADDCEIEYVTPTLVVSKHHRSRSLLIRFGVPWDFEGEVDPENLELVRACNPAGWIDPQRLIDEHLVGPGNLESDFKRFHLNMLTEDEDAPIKEHEWEACRVDGLVIPDESRAWSASDLGFTGDWSAHVVAAHVGDRIALEARGWEPPTSDGMELDIRSTVDAHARGEAMRLRMQMMLVDKYQARLLMQDWESDGLPVAMFGMERDFMCPASISFVEAVKMKLIAHNGDPELKRHVLNLRKRDLGTSWMFMKHPRNDDGMPDGSHFKTDLGFCAVAATHLARSGQIDAVSEYGIF